MSTEDPQQESSLTSTTLQLCCGLCPLSHHQAPDVRYSDGFLQGAHLRDPALRQPAQWDQAACQANSIFEWRTVKQLYDRDIITDCQCSLL